jgi:sulfur-oxidizing protein SoxA
MNHSLIGALCAIAVAGSAFAQAPKKPAAKPAAAPAVAAEVKDAATLEFEKFRAEMEDSNPAELFEMKGEEQWKTKRGPKNVLAGRKLRSRAGRRQGRRRLCQDAALFRRCRHAVMDAERRIVWCMVEKQGFKFDDIAKRPFANDTFTPDITNLVTYVAGHSRKMKIDVPLTDPKVREAWEIGKEIAAYRAGPYDFSCNTCHGSDGKRIRMQNLPNISTPAGAMSGVQGWPGYRMTGGVMLTHQWRMGDCFRQQRFPQPKYASDAVTYLLTYMIGNANGQVYKGPGIKR